MLGIRLSHFVIYNRRKEHGHIIYKVNDLPSQFLLIERVTSFAHLSFDSVNINEFFSQGKECKLETIVILLQDMEKDQFNCLHVYYTMHKYPKNDKTSIYPKYSKIKSNYLRFVKYNLPVCRVNTEYNPLHIFLLWSVLIRILYSIFSCNTLRTFKDR